MFIVIILQVLLVYWLIKYLIRRDKGPKEPVLAVIYAGILGVFAVIVAGIINSIVLPIIGLPGPATSAAGISLTTLIIGVLSIGMTEELAKALPLKRFIYHKGYFNEVSDGIIFFGITGMVFGALENIFYALNYGSAVGLDRIIAVPFMHAGFTSIVGYFIARRKVLGRPEWTVTYGFLLAIGLHSLYNFGLFYDQPWSRMLSFALIVIINLTIFYLYWRARRTDARHVPTPRPSPLA